MQYARDMTDAFKNRAAVWGLSLYWGGILRDERGFVHAAPFALFIFVNIFTSLSSSVATVKGFTT